MHKLIADLLLIGLLTLIGLVAVLLWLAPSSCPNVVEAILHPEACEG